MAGKAPARWKTTLAVKRAATTGQMVQLAQNPMTAMGQSRHIRKPSGLRGRPATETYEPTWTAARWVGFEALAALTFAGVPASQN